MSDKDRCHRSGLSQHERALRSALTQIASGRRVLRGSLQERFRVCGKPKCRCARGEKHHALYLVFAEGKKLRQLYVPKEWEERVRLAVDNYQTATETLRRLSELCWEDVRKRKE